MKQRINKDFDGKNRPDPPKNEIQVLKSFPGYNCIAVNEVKHKAQKPCSIRY
jgi:hypothetical protein